MEEITLKTDEPNTIFKNIFFKWKLLFAGEMTAIKIVINWGFLWRWYVDMKPVDD